MDSLNWKKTTIAALMVAMASANLTTASATHFRPTGSSPTRSANTPNNIIVGTSNFLNGDANKLYGSWNQL